MALKQTEELDKALQTATDRHATELYLLPGEPIAWGQQGKIERSDGEGLSAEDVRRIAVAAVGEQRLDEIGGRTGRIVTSCGLEGVANGQMCIASSRGELTIVIRLFPTRIPDVRQIEVPPAILKAARSSHGLMLFGGLHGSGKTTVLLSVLDDLNARESLHICLLEDPSSVILTPKRSLVQHREVGTDVPSIVAGIATAVTQHVNVLAIGELRTEEQVQACLTAAENGILVMSQIHCPSPRAAIRRLVEVQPPANAGAVRRSLADLLRCVEVTRLFPRADGPGKVAAYGLLLPDAEMRQAIADGRDPLDRKSPLPAGHQTLADDVRRLAREQRISQSAAEEALAELGLEDN